MTKHSLAFSPSRTESPKLTLISVSALEGVCGGGTAEVRHAIGCGVAQSSRLLNVQYAAPADGSALLKPGIDGTRNFALSNIKLVSGHKYCIDGSFTVLSQPTGQLQSKHAYPQ